MPKKTFKTVIKVSAVYIPGFYVSLSAANMLAKKEVKINRDNLIYTINGVHCS